MRISRIQAWLGKGTSAVLTFSAVACSGEAGSVAGDAPLDPFEIGIEESANAEQPEIDQKAQAILNGDPLNASPQAVVFGDAFGGFVALGHAPQGNEKLFCSGTLMNNSVLITARHCLTDSSTSYLVDTPWLINVSMGRNSYRQNRTVKRIFFHTNPRYDLALVTVESGFLMVNANDELSTEGYVRPKFNGPIGSHDGMPMFCLGHGRSVESCDDNGNNCTGGGVGTLRSALLLAEFIETGSSFPSFYRFHPNGSGQIIAHGDSGGSCIDWVQGFLLGRPDRATVLTVHENGFPGAFANDVAIQRADAPGWEEVGPPL